MSAFIVSGGSLLEIGCPSTLNRATQQATSFETTLGGRRLAYIRRGGRRSWSLDVSVAKPSEVSTIEALARRMGLYGWYGPDAAVGNLLSPQGSGFDPAPAGASSAGLVQLPDGTVAESVAATGMIQVGTIHGTYEMVPLRSGLQVTVSAWGFGGLRLQGFWRNSTGTSLGSFVSPISSHAGWGWRSHTMTPPEGAAFVQLSLTQGTAYALPSISWGATGRAEMGTGCPKALLHSPSHTPVALWEGANYTDSSYTVTEVG